MLGGAPYGYRYIRRTDTSEARYEIVEDEAVVVRELFRRYTQDQVSIGDLARLPESEIASRLGLGHTVTEPAAAGAPGEADVLRRLHASGLALVVVDHDMSFLLPISSRLVVLSAGQKIKDGQPEEVLNDEEVVRIYLGENYRSGKSARDGAS